MRVLILTILSSVLFVRCEFLCEPYVADDSIFLVFTPNENQQVQVSYEYKHLVCDNFEHREDIIELQKAKNFSKVIRQYSGHHNHLSVMNKGKGNIKFIGQYYEFYPPRDSYERFKLPVEKTVSCGLFPDNEEHRCNKKQQEVIMHLYKSLGYKGYVELEAGQTHTFKKSDFFVEREGKLYEWHQWTRDSILKSWKE